VIWRGTSTEDKGQVVVMMSVGMVAVVAVLLLVLNAAVTLLSYRALTRTAEHAATAALRSFEAGLQQVDQAKAQEEAEKVLAIELGNVRFMKETPAQVASTLDLTVHNPSGDTVVVNGQTYHGPVVEVSLDAHLCPPVWSCIPVEGYGMTSLETTHQSIETATPVSRELIEVTPTPE